MAHLTYQWPQGFTAHDLPPLTGSPKQVAWAEDRRSKAVGILTEEIDRVRRVAANKGQPLSGSDLDAYANRIAAGMAPVFTTRSSARWWIDTPLTMRDLFIAHTSDPA